jgi:UDP-glucose 4-epimerase
MPTAAPTIARGAARRLVAGARHIGEVLGWKARHHDIRTLCESAIRWERNLQRMPKPRKP